MTDQSADLDLLELLWGGYEPGRFDLIRIRPVTITKLPTLISSVIANNFSVDNQQLKYMIANDNIVELQLLFTNRGLPLLISSIIINVYLSAIADGNVVDDAFGKLSTVLQSLIADIVVDVIAKS
ncbi:hypothetical protein Fot_17991 [Forsythia ovata]|uniref:Uncharacterized protein n=1 Tax=Forsythia ovata TaxID=205694 RepID=A0ABD1VJL1_9LAMI